MPRVNVVKKARTGQGTCSCGKKINVGDPYKWIKFRYGGKRVKCGSCSFRASELTQSDFLGQVYDLNDRLGNLSPEDDIDDIRSEIESIADDFESLGQECEEKRNNMPEQLQDSESGQLLEERSSACSDIASNLQSVDTCFDEEELRAVAKKEVTTSIEEYKAAAGEDYQPPDEDEIEERIEESYQEKAVERKEEIISEAQEYCYEGG